MSLRADTAFRGGGRKPKHHRKDFPMKKHLPVLLLLLLSLACVVALVACDTGNQPDATTTAGEDKGPYTVSLLVEPGSRVTVSGLTTKLINHGQTAEFSVKVQDGYYLECSAGEYDPASERLTLSNVTEDTEIVISTVFATCTVSILPGEHFTVTGDMSKLIAVGGNHSFTVTPEKGWRIASVSCGTYDASTGKLSVRNIKADTEITITCEKRSGWDVTVAGAGFTADAAKKEVKDGASVTFTLVTEPYHYIVGTDAGTYDAATGILTVTDVTDDIVVHISVNRARINYFLNDGTAAIRTVEPDFTFYACPNTLWDDGSFSRAGYTLVEYNTKADGTGESYSLGSKIWYDPAQPELNLYCIWMQETNRNDFTFTRNADDTYTVTSYQGDEETVVIPSVYSGFPVVSIAAGAFNGRRVATLVMPRRLKTVESDAFVGCSSLVTVYFPDSIQSIPDDAFDAATYSNLHHFYLNAAVAPTYTYTYDGMYRVKWDHVMASKAQGRKVIVLVAGSSAVYGFSAQYMEKLMSGEYDVINFGTICTTAGRLYVEALASLLTEDDILIWAPEASTAYQMGSGVLDTFKIFRDTEGMYNVYRAVDIAHFSNYFTGLTDFYGNAQSGRRNMQAKDYEGYNVARNPSLAHEFRCTYPDQFTVINYWGDMVAGTNKNKTRNSTPGNKVSFDGMTTSEVLYGSAVSGTDIADYAEVSKAALQALKDKGVKVYFGFAPVNRNALIGQASLPAQQAAYDALVAELYGVEVLGSCSDHIYTYTYMTNGDAHHLTDKGTQINTYRYYTELCTALGLTAMTEAEAKTVGASVPGLAW